MSFLLSIIFNNDYFRYISMLLSEHLFLKVLVFHKNYKILSEKKDCYNQIRFNLYQKKTV